jgi:hypothetical protein
MEMRENEDQEVETKRKRKHFYKCIRGKHRDRMEEIELLEQRRGRGRKVAEAIEAEPESLRDRIPAELPIHVFTPSLPRPLSHPLTHWCLPFSLS